MGVVSITEASWMERHQRNFQEMRSPLADMEAELQRINAILANEPVKPDLAGLKQRLHDIMSGQPTMGTSSSPWASSPRTSPRASQRPSPAQPPVQQRSYGPVFRFLDRHRKGGGQIPSSGLVSVLQDSQQALPLQR